MLKKLGMFLVPALIVGAILFFNWDVGRTLENELLNYSTVGTSFTVQSNGVDKDFSIDSSSATFYDSLNINGQTNLHNHLVLDVNRLLYFDATNDYITSNNTTLDFVMNNIRTLKIGTTTTIQCDGTNADFKISPSSATFYDSVYLTGTVDVSADGSTQDFFVGTSSISLQNNSYVFGNLYLSGADKTLSMSDTGIVTNSTYDQLLIYTEAGYGQQLVIGKYESRTKDFDHAAQTNPTLFIHSATDPDSDNTQWIGLTHDQTNAVISTGKGLISLSTGTICYSQTEAELKSFAPPTAGAIYYDSTNMAVVVSTGTGVGAFGLIYNGATAPTGW